MADMNDQVGANEAAARQSIADAFGAPKKPSKAGSAGADPMKQGYHPSAMPKDDSQTHVFNQHDPNMVGANEAAARASIANAFK